MNHLAWVMWLGLWLLWAVMMVAGATMFIRPWVHKRRLRRTGADCWVARGVTGEQRRADSTPVLLAATNDDLTWRRYGLFGTKELVVSRSKAELWVETVRLNTAIINGEPRFGLYTSRREVERVVECLTARGYAVDLTQSRSPRVG